MDGRRSAGGFGLASVVGLLAGLAVIGPSDATLSASPESIVEWYRTADAARVYTGGYVQVLALLCFLPFAAQLSRLLGRSERQDSAAATTALCGAGVYVAGSLTPGMAAGAAALWVAQHAADDSAVYALNHLRTFSYQMSLLAWAVFFGGVAVSALSGRTLPRWLAASAAVVAAALVLGVAGAYDHWHDLASLLALVWVLAASVWLLRTRDVPARAVGRRQTTAQV